MSKTWKRFLALLLAMTMILSLGITGFADDGETEEETGTAAEESEEDLPEETILETEPISPDKLNVRKLGVEEIEEEDEELIPMDEEGLDQIVRVSIFLDKPSTLGAGFAADGVGTNSAAMAYRDGLRSEQEQLTAQIESVLGHPLDVQWNITLAANAISANVTLGDMVKIREIPGVKAVQRENQYLPMEGTEGDDPNTANTSENMVGATEAWANGFTGAGSRIAIVDTGIDTAHQSFAEEPFLYSVDLANARNELMTQADISAVLADLNARQKMSSVTAAQLNQNGSKIVYGFNYIDGNTTIDHNSDTAGNHGSHVAGIAAANRYIGTAHNDSAATVGAVGMAPDAQLLVMKVFGAGGGAYDSDYFVAIEDAILLGADVCNLSLGSGAPGWTFDNEYQGLLNNWANGEHNGKMVLSISAGNSYAAADFTAAKHPYIEDAYTHTGGSPGSFVNSLCVAAAQNTLTTGKPLKFNDQSIFYAESTEGDDGPYTNPEISTIAGTYDLVYIDALGESGDYSAVNGALSLSGKVVIVNRGEISFSEKGNNAISYSPKALIVANNDEGTIRMDLSDYTGTFPMVSISLKDANTIKTGCTAHTAGDVTYYTGSITITETEESQLLDRSEATITDFSSWGVPGSLLMKPEITAPGGNIYSVYGTAKTNSGSEGGTDQYVSYDGTSMAAPHIAGLAAVLAERCREDDISSLNPDLSGYSVRAITQSLLMSTATPMAPGGEYLSILQQGAGLADVSLATAANSVVMVDPSNSYLTGLTGAAADGKVKVELGDDPARKGDYQFGFTVYNLTGDPMTFDVETEIFTQKSDGEQMLPGTVVIPSGTSFLWEGDNPVTSGHDVNKDGVTNINDAQAILDYLSGVNDGENLDLEAGEMDGDDMLTTYDAYLLLGWEGDEDEPANTGVIAAHSSRYCSVRVTLSADLKDWLDAEYPGGAFLEGFTYITQVGTTKDGGTYTDEHSIPILGYFGSWTDANMFETTSYAEALYGSEQLPYSGNTDTNYLTLTMNGANVKFSGNPYMVEDSFPTDRLAINSSTNMVRIAYNLIRCAGTTGFAVSKLNKDGLVDEVLSSTVTGNEVTGLWYYVSQGSWQNTTTKFYSINKTPGSYGLREGDLFRVGFYAVPEYNGMLVNEDYTSESAGLLDDEGFQTLLESGDLGKGAFVGYDFVVDDTAPQIGLATLEGSTLTVAATDNLALAYVAVMSLDGQTVYKEVAPGVDEYEISLDASDAIANAYGYVAVFVGDYAGNEAAVAVKVNDNTHVEKTVYVLTDSVAAGEDYLIVNTSNTGAAYTLNYTLNTSGSTATVATNAVTINGGTADTQNKPYIDSKDVSSTAPWTAGSGSSSGTWTFNNNGWYLRLSNNNNLTITKDTSRRDWTWDGTNNRLSIKTSTFASARYLRYYNNSFSVNTATNSVYLFQKTVISYEVDPYGVTSVTVTPEELDLYKGSTAELTAKVLPLTATDRTVTWTSGNTSVATVDELGKVTAVGAGSTVIRATANGDPSKYAEIPVEVTVINKALNGIVWDEEGQVFFSSFNSNNLPTWSKLSGSVELNGSPLYLSNAYMYNSSTLYASTCDLSDTSVIYSVNRSSYALTEFATNFVPAFGICRGPTGFTSYGLKCMVYGFAGYLIMGNVDPDHEDPDDSSSAMYSGLPYGLLNLSETAVGDAYVAGVCAKAVGTQSCTYYFLDETGKIWLTTLNYSNSDGFTFTDPILQIDTGISAGLTYQSLYYDGTYLYWSHQVDNIAELIIYVPSTGKLYHAGNFGEGVWPAAGLYVNGSAAPASVEDEIMGGPIQLRPLATREQLLTADVLEHLARYGFDLSNLLPEQFEEDEDLTEEDVLPLDGEELAEEPAPVEEPEPIEEPAPAEDNAYLGGLNFFRSAAPSISTVDPQTIPDEEYNEDHKNEISIEIAEDEDSHNGLFAVIYDPEAVTLTGYEVNEDISVISVFVDEDKSIVTVAYANVKDDDGDLPITSVSSRGGVTDYILAGEPIITLNFTVNCADSEIEVDTLERNEEFELDEISTLTVYGAGHEWGEPTWEWAEDYSTAVATFVCAKDETHTQTVNATITSETVNATCEAAGSTTYTATVTLDSETYTDTKTVEIPATGHEWGEPTWTWAEDNTATATFVCTKDETHTKTVKATITSETVNATCEGAGSTTYTATVELEGKTYTDTKTVEIPAAGHEWGEPTWTWAEDFTSATAAFVCAKDETHTKTLEARITSEEVENGTLYTATVTLDGETYTDQKLKEITTVTVTFDAGNGTVDPATMEVNVGGSIETLPEPVLENWKFIGWFTEPMENYLLAGQGTQVTTETTFNEGTTVYAHWRLPGDINGDGSVNNKDVTRLTRWLKTHDVEVVSFNLDVNGDGSVNNKDLTRLVRWVKSHDVVLN